MVAGANLGFPFAARRFNCAYARLCPSSIYLLNILEIHNVIRLMTSKVTINIKPKKKRIPTPQKPPKVMPNKNAYFRNKEKNKVRKNKEEE